ncbi:hypothetical protein LUTEI9C_80315 [Luteimonas sp. 9C]|nr:hypothetical protein LUTEI9C_80315 [Luteimonas sp. 9C]
MPAHLRSPRVGAARPTRSPGEAPAVGRNRTVARQALARDTVDAKNPRSSPTAAIPGVVPCAIRV